MTEVGPAIGIGSGTAPESSARPTRRWLPRRVMITRSAAERDHTAEIVRRCEAAGVPEIRWLPGDRLLDLRGATERETYALAKSTLAVVVAPPSARRPQPIPPSADWRIDLARGCPAHCQYCYLAGSLSGPPVTRAFANLDEILAEIGPVLGRGEITSTNAERAHEGTTFELSCYTDPLGIEPVTGSLAAAIAAAGAGRWGTDVQLRFTTKYDDVAELTRLTHAGRTRARFSVNAESVARRFDGGTASVSNRLRALHELAAAGYPVGLTIAPVMPVEGWEVEYAALLEQAAAAVAGLPHVDLTVEIITHRFTPGSKDVLSTWYPRTKLEMEEGRRTAKRSKFGGVKYVYPKDTMRELRSWFGRELARRLPNVPLLYWT